MLTFSILALCNFGVGNVLVGFACLGAAVVAGVADIVITIDRSERAIRRSERAIRRARK